MYIVTGNHITYCIKTKFNWFQLLGVQIWPHRRMRGTREKVARLWLAVSLTTESGACTVTETRGTESSETARLLRVFVICNVPIKEFCKKCLYGFARIIIIIIISSVTISQTICRTDLSETWHLHVLCYFQQFGLCQLGGGGLILKICWFCVRVTSQNAWIDLLSTESNDFRVVWEVAIVVTWIMYKNRFQGNLFVG